MPGASKADRSDDPAANLQQLHQRLLDRDPLASTDLAEAFLTILKTGLEIRHPDLEEVLLWEAATSALLNYIERPQTFDPTRLSLPAYLRMSAEGDLRNALAKQNRYYRRNLPLEVVEVLRPVGNYNIEDQFLARQEMLERWQARNQSHARIPPFAPLNELDRRLLALMEAGERRTIVYAAELGLENLSSAGQSRLVKRHKDRLKIMLKRHFAKNRVEKLGE